MQRLPFSPRSLLQVHSHAWRSGSACTSALTSMLLWFTLLHSGISMGLDLFWCRAMLWTALEMPLTSTVSLLLLVFSLWQLGFGSYKPSVIKYESSKSAWELPGKCCLRCMHFFPHLLINVMASSSILARFISGRGRILCFWHGWVYTWVSFDNSSHGVWVQCWLCVNQPKKWVKQVLQMNTRPRQCQLVIFEGWL